MIVAVLRLGAYGVALVPLVMLFSLIWRAHGKMGQTLSADRRSREWLRERLDRGINLRTIFVEAVRLAARTG